MCCNLCRYLASTVSLSVNQASSIQNLGVTCESITIGMEGCVALCMTPIGQPCTVNQ
jgi:hypothetical protein